MSDNENDQPRTTLLACPFCLGTNVIVDQFGLGAFCASCEDDGCNVISPEAPTQAAEKWNACKRPEPALDEWWSETGERTQAAVISSRIASFASEARLLTQFQRQALQVTAQELQEFANG